MPDKPDSPAVITLTGSAFVEVELLSFYDDAGASAAKPLSPQIIPLTVEGASAVNTATPGNYTIRYSAVGAEPVVRTVLVFDPCMRRDPPYPACKALSTPGNVVCPVACSAGGSCMCLNPVKAADVPAVAAPFQVPSYESPPAMTLLGSGIVETLPDNSTRMTHTLMVFSAWADPGATAIDPLDGDLSQSISKSYGPLGPVNASAATPPGQFYSTFYSAQNGGELQSLAAERRVVVVDPCAEATPGEFMCGPGGQCSVDGLCAAISPPLLASALAAAAVNSPPVIKLLGPPGAAMIAAGNKYESCPPGTVRSFNCEWGAEATDAEDGNLSPRILACSPPLAPGATPKPASLFATSGIFACYFAINSAAAFANKPIPVSADGVFVIPGTYPLNFSVTDSAGQTAAVQRLLIVTPNCRKGERVCEDMLSCSKNGICAQGFDFDDSLAPGIDFNAAAAAMTINEGALIDGQGNTTTIATEAKKAATVAPKLELITTADLGPSIAVPQFTNYSACDADQVPAQSALCEPGASATDVTGGDLTSKVLACPPAACLPAGCPGHEFVRKGLQGCVNTSAKVGAVFSVEFVVFSDVEPSLYTSATRTIQIAPPCDVGKSFCDGVCYDVTCDEVNALAAAVPLPPAEPPAPPPLPLPLVTLLVPEPGFRIGFGHSVPVGLTRICSSPLPGAAASAVPAWPSCVGFARDAETGQDLSANTSVVQVGVTPMPCPLATFTQCAPGAYTYALSARSPAGAVKEVPFEVWVVQQGAVVLTVGIESTAQTAAQAQLEAASIANGTTTSPASERAKAAVAASLTSDDDTVFCGPSDVSIVSVDVAGASPPFKLVRASS